MKCYSHAFIGKPFKLTWLEINLKYGILHLRKFISSLFFSEWDRDNPKVYPKILPVLIKNGVPEALRGEVWQRITGASLQQEEIIDAYRVLITKESPDEKVILRDIHRTFPAHEFFKEAGGVGQESLYRISKVKILSFLDLKILIDIFP